MGITFANESPEYRAARDRLLEQEIGLRRQMEAVAEARRALPAGPEVREDYQFQGLGPDGRPRAFRLSELFVNGADSLVIYHYMFPRHSADSRRPAESGETAALPRAEQPCPSCTGLIDQFEGAAEHFAAAGGNLAIVAKAPLEHLLAVARDRGWRHLRLLSAAGSRFNRDYHAEDDKGEPAPMMTVFRRGADDRIRLFWSSELFFAPSDSGQDPRAAGTLEPLWNLFDLTPGGRPNFGEQLEYGSCHGAAAGAAASSR